jgi:hypothetical protein
MPPSVQASSQAPPSDVSDGSVSFESLSPGGRDAHRQVRRERERCSFLGSDRISPLLRTLGSGRDFQMHHSYMYRTLEISPPVGEMARAKRGSERGLLVDPRTPDEMMSHTRNDRRAQ